MSHDKFDDMSVILPGVDSTEGKNFIKTSLPASPVSSAEAQPIISPRRASDNSSVLSGPIIEQWHYRPRGYAGCTNPIYGFVLCTLACVAVLVMFFFFYPQATDRGSVTDHHSTSEIEDTGGH